jgi:GrpB-like predicted nucleotidyltransferase (UPF0157 family)
VILTPASVPWRLALLVPIPAASAGRDGLLQTWTVVDFAAAGLGLEYRTVRHVRADGAWAAIASELAAVIGVVLADLARGVEHIGSTAVPGLLAKPIVDLAIGLHSGVAVEDVAHRMSQLGWIYRGDAGDDGGWVFVMEDFPWHRVAHAHCVQFGGAQWVRYLEFRDLLRRSPEARKAYEDTKMRLAQQYPDGRAEYTAGKGPTVQRLRAEGADAVPERSDRAGHGGPVVGRQPAHPDGVPRGWTSL